MASSYRQLSVWQKAFELSCKIYELTKMFPKEEMFGLTSQMRRSSVSIPSNIAEGKGRGSDKDFIRFLYIAKGSGNELETQILLAEKLQYIFSDKSRELQKNCEEVLKMIVALIQRLKTDSH